MKEVWKDIKNYKGLYQVSNLGRIKSLVKNTNNQYGKTERILKLKTDKCGYQQICLSKNGEHKYYLVHRLVYEAFYGRIPFWMQVNHINENKTDNNRFNLNILSCKQNMNWGTVQERKSKKRTGMYNTKNSTPILQYDKEGNLIKEWVSIREIERQLGFKSCCICNYLKGRIQTAYGYIWKYKKAG